ncbi:MAG: hypothetical protein RLY86_621 [Pseudomonadota bacterium]|jgi:capsular exopolysaccharide synthesis family protein
MDVREGARRLDGGPAAPGQPGAGQAGQGYTGIGQAWGPTGNPGLFGGPGASTGLDPHDTLTGIVRTLWRRRLVLLVCLVIVPAFAYWFISGLTPLYSASAQVLVSGREQNVLNLRDVVAGPGQELESVASEIEVIRSREAAREVVRRLRLDRAPGPSPGVLYVGVAPPEPTVVERARRWVMSAITPKPQPVRTERPAADQGAEGGEMGPERPARAADDYVVDFLLSNLWVGAAGRSYVVNIGFTSTDPVLAAQIANEFARVYLDRQEDARAGAAGRANEWLSRQITDMQAQVQAAESAIEEFRARSDLMATRDTPLSSQELADLNAQLTIARADQAQARARLTEVERAARGNGDVSGIGDVLSSPLIQDLRVQESQVRRQLADLSESIGPRHPDFIRVQADLRDLREAIGQEIQKIVQGLRGQVRVAEARVASLEAELTSAKAEVAGTSDASVRLRALEREAEASRGLLEAFLLRSQELSAQQGFRQANASIVSRANVPGSPAYPQTFPMMVLSAIAAGALGLAIIAVMEVFDGTYRSAGQTARDTGLPSLGMIPAVPRRKMRKGLPRYLRGNPRSLYAEAIRKTYAALARSGALPQTLAVTSTYPGEGKTSTALSLAVFAASLGQRVVVVDFDIRRPMVQAQLGLPPEAGLLEVLRGECALEEVLEVDPEFGLSVLGAGRGENVADLLDARRIRTLIRMLAQTHDLIIFDTAPALAVADTRMICQQVDGVVFAVRWASTARRAVQGAIAQLDLGDKAAAGVLLTRVDTVRHRAYGFQDSALYHRSLQRYYTG